MLLGKIAILKKILPLLLVFVTLFNVQSAIVLAQSNVNAIVLSIPKVTQDGQTKTTKTLSPNAFEFEGELTIDDAIRYGWNAVSLDIKCKTSPQNACGYLKVYLNDDSSESNLLTEIGSSPLLIESIAPRLTEGATKLMFVYINSRNPTDTSTKVTFDFKFKNTTKKPQIKVTSPSPDSLFGRGIKRDIEVELSNFTLESTDSGSPNRGKLNIYHSQVSPETIIGTVSISTAGAMGKQIAVINTEDFKFDAIPDSLNAKLIFVLTNSKGELLETRTELTVRSNYNSSLDVGLPKVLITEPRKDKSSLTINSNQKIIVQIDNFELLPDFVPGAYEEGKGYMQILIDDAPIKNTWSKNSFSLAEINVADMPEGRKTIKVQLLSKDLTKLVPEASDSIDVIYVPSDDQKITEPVSQVQSNIWRVVMVMLIVILVIGGVAVLITKG